MVQEASVGGKISAYNQKQSTPLFPKTFYSHYTAAQSKGSVTGGSVTPMKKIQPLR
jgi:hypothetical protein